MLQSSGLYVQIPPPHRKVADQLHKTNILNYDQHYRHLNRLWSTLYEQKNKTPSFKEKIESYWKFQHDYVEEYSLLIILKAFSALGFQIHKLEDQSSSYTLRRGSLIFRLYLEIDLKIWKISSQRDVLNIVPIANEIDEHSLEELEHHPNLVIFALGTEEASNQSDRFVWVNPFNFEAIEKFIVIVLEWIYKPILQSYSKVLQLGRIPQSVKNELSLHTYIVNEDEQIQLVNVLSAQQLSALESVCTVSNTEHVYQIIKKQHDDYLHMTHCPICLSQADFKPRSSNQTFIADCTNLECGVNYKLVSNSNHDKEFYLQASGEWKKGGRWRLNFKV